ncbi:MAG: peptidyl-prolyl cis-trans isomerase [Opitutaceae bacterium]|tara:strand:- start:13148 stop:14809 length:1662 start_codon:yes stop_codon:yes gene_type:complete
MISWIQTTFQRHFRFLFFGLLVVLIISFVFTIGAPGIGSAEREIQARTYFDLNLSSPEDQGKLYIDANLSIALQAGFQNIPQAQMQEFALERYAALYLADQINLPGPTEVELVEFIHEIRAFMGPTGEFDATSYASFRDNLKLSGQFTEADVDRVLRNDYRVREVQELLGGPGYVTGNEVNFQLARTDTTWGADVARIDYTTYAPTIEPSDDELQTYFEENAFRYDSAPQVRVSYIEFPATRYLAQIQLTEENIRAYYEANPARFPRAETATDTGTPEISVNDPDIDFLAVRDQVSAALRYEQARRFSVEAAADLTVALFDSAPSPEAIETFVASQGDTLRSADPFDRASPPAFLNTAPQLVGTAFTLSADRRVSDPLPTAAGAVVLIWEESIPSAPSLYIAVTDAVRTDYVESQKRQRFVDLGRNLSESLADQVASGKSFADAVNALDNLEGATATVESHADFTRADPPEAFPRVSLGSLEGLSSGDVSEMVLSGEEGLLTHAVSRIAPALGTTDTRYVELKDQLGQLNSATTASGIMRTLISAQLETATGE